MTLARIGVKVIGQWLGSWLELELNIDLRP